MFTGIIEQQAMVNSRSGSGIDARFQFQVPDGFLQDCRIGDSISVSGVCLTIVEMEANGFSADVSAETLSKTTLGSWTTGTEVNLELALRAADRLGGHLVSGHVDGCGVLSSITPDGVSKRLEFEFPAEFERYVAKKGSICVDGVSLTVNEVNETGRASWFQVNVIPHTLEVTTLGKLKTGDAVNLEVDMIARYLERLRVGT